MKCLADSTSAGTAPPTQACVIVPAKRDCGAYLPLKEAMPRSQLTCPDERPREPRPATPNASYATATRAVNWNRCHVLHHLHNYDAGSSAPRARGHGRPPRADVYRPPPTSWSVRNQTCAGRTLRPAPLLPQPLSNASPRRLPYSRLPTAASTASRISQDFTSFCIVVWSG